MRWLRENGGRSRPFFLFGVLVCCCTSLKFLLLSLALVQLEQICLKVP